MQLRDTVDELVPIFEALRLNRIEGRTKSNVAAITPRFKNERLLDVCLLEAAVTYHLLVAQSTTPIGY